MVLPSGIIIYPSPFTGFSELKDLFDVIDFSDPVKNGSPCSLPDIRLQTFGLYWSASLAGILVSSVREQEFTIGLYLEGLEPAAINFELNYVSVLKEGEKDGFNLTENRYSDRFLECNVKDIAQFHIPTSTTLLPFEPELKVKIRSTSFWHKETSDERYLAVNSLRLIRCYIPFDPLRPITIEKNEHILPNTLMFLGLCPLRQSFRPYSSYQLRVVLDTLTCADEYDTAVYCKNRIFCLFDEVMSTWSFPTLGKIPLPSKGKAKSRRKRRRVRQQPAYPTNEETIDSS